MKRLLAFMLVCLLIMAPLYANAEAADIEREYFSMRIADMNPVERQQIMIALMSIVRETDGDQALEEMYSIACSDAELVVDSTVDEDKEMTEEKLLALIKEQPLAVIDTKYAVQSDDWKALYPDMLTAIVKNNTKNDIKDAVVAFVAWDKNNLPVKIEGQFDFMGGSYVKRVSYDDINLVPGGRFGDDYGFSLSEDCTIAEFKAIVVSYETFDGETWENPYFRDFCDLYEGKKLKK